jgi:hypothetical protein
MRVIGTLAITIAAFIYISVCPSAAATRGYKRQYYHQAYSHIYKHHYNGTYRHGRKQRYTYQRKYPRYNIGATRPSNGLGVSDLADRFKDVLEAGMDQLRIEGVPDQHLRSAVAHLAGQAYAESGLNPHVYHDGGIGYGIYGTNGARLVRMRQWMTANKIPNTSAGQMRYMAHEAMTGYPVTRNVLMRANISAINSDVPIVTRNFESPASPRNEIRIRAVRAFL